jgi:hypothetical protein
MRETELFEDFDTVYLCGDTGNGFRGYDVAAFLSTWEKEFGKRVVQCFLCPRHAYSLCDAHFGHLYEIIHTEKVLGWLISEEDYQAAINDSIEAGKIKNTETFVWKEFDHEKSPMHKKVSRGQYITGVTHLEYPDGPGWALVRTVSGSGPWRLMKLFKEHRWKHDFCKKCTLASNRPVRAHLKNKCPYSRKGVAKSQGDPRKLEAAIEWVPAHRDEQVVKNHVDELKRRLEVFKVASLADVNPENGSFLVVNNGQLAPAPTWSVVKFLRRATDQKVQVHWYGHTRNPKTDKHRLKKQVKLCVGMRVCVHVCRCSMYVIP